MRLNILANFGTRWSSNFERDTRWLKLLPCSEHGAKGETRTGNPWDAEDRVFWYHFEWWWIAQLENWQEGKLTSWQTPLTTIKLDRLAGPHFFKDTVQQNKAPPTSPQQNTGVKAVIDAADYETAATFVFMLKSFGYETIWQQPRKPIVEPGLVQLAIWNGGQLEGDELERLTAFYKQWHRARVVALLDFPRVETTQAISAIGQIAILGKPYSMDEFTAVLPHPTNRHKSRSEESHAANPTRESASK